MGLLSLLDSLINSKIMKETVEIFDISKMLDEIAKDLDCTYSKEIDPATFLTNHCFYQRINGTNYRVASISEDCIDMLKITCQLKNTNLRNGIVSTLKYEKEFNLEKIKQNARINCSMKY